MSPKGPRVPTTSTSSESPHATQYSLHELDAFAKQNFSEAYAAAKKYDFLDFEIRDIEDLDGNQKDGVEVVHIGRFHSVEHRGYIFALIARQDTGYKGEIHLAANIVKKNPFQLYGSKPGDRLKQFESTDDAIKTQLRFEGIYKEGSGFGPRSGVSPEERARRFERMRALVGYKYMADRGERFSTMDGHILGWLKDACNNAAKAKTVADAEEKAQAESAPSASGEESTSDDCGDTIGVAPRAAATRKRVREDTGSDFELEANRPPKLLKATRILRRGKSTTLRSGKSIKKTKMTGEDNSTTPLGSPNPHEPIAGPSSRPNQPPRSDTLMAMVQAYANKADEREVELGHTRNELDVMRSDRDQWKQKYKDLKATVDKAKPPNFTEELCAAEERADAKEKEASNARADLDKLQAHLNVLSQGGLNKND